MLFNSNTQPESGYQNITIKISKQILKSGTTKSLTKIENANPTPSTSTTWIWSEYYKCLSLKGLDETMDFKKDLPLDSYQWKLFAKYIEYGHAELQP